MSDTEREENACYECICGSSIKFHNQEFQNLRWLSERFGYKNIGDAISDIRECCDCPQYFSVPAYRSVESGPEQ